MSYVSPSESSPRKYAVVTKKYAQSSIRKRLEACFLDHVGEILTREQLIEVARNPTTGLVPENWHQRISELRTDIGYNILSQRDRTWLKVSEYLLESAERRKTLIRTRITSVAWSSVLVRANNACEWRERGEQCLLREGQIDPVGGGTVHLTPDHKTPHSSGIPIDVDNPEEWQALCGRHQVVKKNYWDSNTGKLNFYAIVQAATTREKREVYKYLKDYFEQ